MSDARTCPDCGHAAGTITTTRLSQPSWREIAVAYWHRMKAEGFTDGNREPDENCFGTFIRDEKGKVTALTVFHDTEVDHAWLWLIYVERPWRRHGHGLSLIRETEAMALALFGKPLRLGAQGHNKPMQALAEKAGFFVDAVWYAKSGPRIAPPQADSATSAEGGAV